MSFLLLSFLHLLTFAAFYTSVIAVVVLLFHYIELLFPDPAMATIPEHWRDRLPDNAKFHKEDTI